ncbi:hypothetical protein ACFOUP_11470 [Belliella kenyensis]|uniref:Antitoxin component YwqK of the YwqJK toxin-antitoxin module n=1 Tax=Belliella kenyensis TaxID=1472724 RepID=A0ABV8EL18_9BACT|nr:hypothetical protein [Belliella kenyensis]MCH7400581.1 hypothetical protein [Belliella kenyensis]MDN3602132.1 hypothetical protein [Belliella kenyensis]
MRNFQVAFYSLISVILIFPSLLIAQEAYEGEYRFNNLEGYATFQLVEGQEGSMLKQGEFRFERKEKDATDNMRFLKTIIAGFYEADKKSGLWDYLDESHMVEVNDVVDFSIDSELTSNQIRLKANYLNGVPNGSWKFVENEFSGGSLRKKAEAEEFKFNNGDIQGKFQFKSFVGNRTHFIRGELNQDGVMHGEWTLVYRQEERLISEVRNYENGFLLGLVKRDLNDDEIIEEMVYYETIAKLNQVNEGNKIGFRVADQKFGIFFNDGFLSDADQYQVQKSGNEFLTNFLVKFLQFDPAYVNQDGVLIDYPIHTRKFVFELTRSQQKLVEELPGKFDELQKTVSQYKDRNVLRLNRQRSDSLSAVYSFFEFQDIKLTQAKELFDLIRSKEIQYYDLAEIANIGLNFVTEEDKINYTFQDQEKQLVLKYEIGDFENDFLVSLESYLNQMKDKTREFRIYADAQLSRIQEDSDLVSLEEQIQERKIKVDTLYYDLDDLDSFSRSLISNVRENIVESQFSRINERYAQAEKFSVKRDEAERMLDLLEELEMQFETIKNISSNWQILDEFYMEETFNPFFNERYEIRFKERLFESGERLYNHYLKSLREETNYTEIKDWTSKIENLIRRMSELRNEDTRSLERRLNRRSSIERIESDLGL